MKHLRYIILTVLVVGLSSCNDWLHVNPGTQKEKDEMFSSEDGVMAALTGAYVHMANNNAYGEQLTLTTLNHLASQFSPAYNSTDYYVQMFDFSNSGVETKIKGIYEQLYIVISRVNAILDEIDAYKHVFKTPGLYEIAKGEALGLRAMCHLDILRLFGPVPSQADDKRILPYIQSLNVELDEHQTFAGFSKLLLEDLAEAEKCLADDPVKTGAESASKYLQDRHLYMNYYAVKALQARANLYAGNKNAAWEAAKTVLDAADAGRYRLTEKNDLESGKDYSYSTEHIFAISYYKMSDRDKVIYNDNPPYYKTDYMQSAQKSLFGTDGTDIREPGISKNFTVLNGGNKWVINKYKYVAANAQSIRESIAAIRLSEMYPIAAETAPLNVAQGYWNDYRSSRDLPTTTLTEATIPSLVLAEYRKEFFGEGQLFYAYKRMNSPKADFLFLPWNVTTPVYVLPKPANEISYDE